MPLFRRIKDHATAARIEEEAYYQAALEEVERGGRRPGIWAKAIANASGDESTAKALYLKLLVQKLKDEAHIANRMSEERARELAVQEERQRREKERERRIREARRRSEQQRAHESASESSPLNSPYALWGSVVLGVLLLTIPLFLGQFHQQTNKGPALAEEAGADSEFESANGVAAEVLSERDAASSTYDELVEDIEARYPQLNPEHSAYSEALIEDVLASISEYEGKEYASTDALILAVDDVLGGLLANDHRSQIVGRGGMDDSEGTSNDSSEATSNDSPEDEPECEYKGVMSDHDYRNCGIDPPS